MAAVECYNKMWVLIHRATHLYITIKRSPIVYYKTSAQHLIQFIIKRYKKDLYFCRLFLSFININRKMPQRKQSQNQIHKTTYMIHIIFGTLKIFKYIRRSFYINAKWIFFPRLFFSLFKKDLQECIQSYT